MKIAIIGYGKMGQMIESICLERKHEVIAKIDEDNKSNLQSLITTADVAIEFTSPQSAVDNYIACFNAGVPVVSGTTGWLDRKSEVENICKQKNAGFFYASNFSIGVNIFFEINKKLAKIMNRFDDYACTMEETHHIHKLDAPSGTAISLADDIIKNIDRINQWQLSENATDNDLSITAFRKGEVTGEHSILYESPVDSISIKHEAKNRRGFALGAVLAAEFMVKKHGIFNMQDLLAL